MVNFFFAEKYFFRFYLTKAELVGLNIEDIDFAERECVVHGRGDKKRQAYFDAKTKVHLLNQGQIIITHYSFP